MKRILCWCAGLCLLAVIACNDKGGAPKKFESIDPETKPPSVKMEMDMNKKFP